MKEPSKMKYQDLELIYSIGIDSNLEFIDAMNRMPAPMAERCEA